MKHAWIPAALCGLGLTLGAAERLLIEDFSDVGTWRSNPVRNTTPGKWFGVDVYLGATPDASRDDGYAGKLLFHFADASKARGRLISSAPRPVSRRCLPTESSSISIRAGFPALCASRLRIRRASGS